MELPDAVKALRAHVGQSQQAFATGLGISIRALANYEASRRPSSLALSRMLKLSQEVGREDLAELFRVAYWQDASRTFPGLTDEESAWVEVLCDLLQSRSTPRLRGVWNDVRKSFYKAAAAIIREEKRSGGVQAGARRSERDPQWFLKPGLDELARRVQGHLLVAEAATLDAKMQAKPRTIEDVLAGDKKEGGR